MIGNSFCFGWEIPLMEALQSVGGALGDKLSVFFTLFGEDLVMLGIIGIFYWGFNKKWAHSIGIRFITALLFGCMLKNIVRRRRPYMDHESITCRRIPTAGAPMDDVLAQGFSFPSLHANDSMTIYGSLAGLTHNTIFRCLCVFMIFAVGISRIFVGVHYPTDVFTGWVIGLSAVIVMEKIEKKVNSHMKIMAVLMVLALPGWFFCISTDFYSAYGLLIGMMASFWLDDKYIRFENTKSIVKAVIRTLGGVAVFAIVSSLLKKPFSKELQESITFAAHAIRAMRYAVGTFAAMGVYPVLFRYI